MSKRRRNIVFDVVMTLLLRHVSTVKARISSPNVVGSCPEALLPTQRQTPSVHQIAEELPPCGDLEEL